MIFQFKISQYCEQTNQKQNLHNSVASCTSEEYQGHFTDVHKDIPFNFLFPDSKVVRVKVLLTLVNHELNEAQFYKFLVGKARTSIRLINPCQKKQKAQSEPKLSKRVAN
jgi:methenyltetrahydromethanopterin cyclohydrolase